VGQVEIPAGVLAGPVREGLLHERVKSQLASRRAGTHSTQDARLSSPVAQEAVEAEGHRPRPSGQQPLADLGRRGRQSSARSRRNYSYQLPKSARKAALRSVLAARHGEGKLVVVDALTLPEPKTKAMVACLKDLGVEGRRARRARGARRRPHARVAEPAHVKVLPLGGLNVYDVLKHATLVITRPALEQARRQARRREMNAVDVHQRPIITEKGTLVNELGNQVVFRVDPRANKVENPPGGGAALQGEGGEGADEPGAREDAPGRQDRGPAFGLEEGLT